MQEPTFSVAPFAAATVNLTTPPNVTVTAAATSSKLVVFGLSDGSISLYDVFGNRLDHHQSLHVGPVAAISLGGGPANDEVVASAGRARGAIRAARLFTGAAAGANESSMLRNGTVCVTKQTDGEVVALAVDPNFGKPRSGDRLAWADKNGRVSLHTAGWFGGTDVIVDAGHGVPISSLAWVQHLLVFATKDGVRVYDTRANRPVCLIAPPGSSAPPSPMPQKREWSGSGSESDKKTEEEEEKKRATREENEEAGGKKDKENRELDSLSSKSNRWALKTKIFMEESESSPLSAHGESTTLLYVTWPAGARILRIGPHKDIIVPSENETYRDIDVVFRLERDSLPATELTPDEMKHPDGALGSIVEDSPLLAVVPFGGNESVALVGTPSKGLALHLISSAGVSIKSMRMAHHGLKDADLLTVPGGDPLLLVVAQPNEARKSEEPSGESSKRPFQDVVYVRSLTTAERVKWLLGQNRFSDALRVAQAAPGGSLRRAEVSLDDIGEQFLDSVRESGDYTRLAEVLPETIVTTTPYVGFRAREKIMQKRKKRWEHWIHTFRTSNKLGVVAPVIPTYEPCLDEETYNRILVELCVSEPAVMLHVLKTWPADVFGVSTVTQAIEEQLATTESDSTRSQEGREPLREGLLMMYGLSGRHDETLNLLLRESSPKVYDYIRSHHLYEAVRSPETITGLYKIDPSAATDILSHAPETVLPPEAVVPILVKVDNSKWLFMYLHAVFRMDADHAPKYHNQLLRLYVEHGREGMLFSFLKTSTHYSLDRALQEMGGPKGLKQGYLARERVYVLSAMGDLNSAMNILLDELGDTFAAIEFASDHGDTVLWERLIEHARTHADTLAALLDSPAGGKVDPVRLVPLLNSEMRIPHLRDRLQRILVDAALERALREDAAAALHHDASVLLKELEECVSVLPS